MLLPLSIILLMAGLVFGWTLVKSHHRRRRLRELMTTSLPSDVERELGKFWPFSRLTPEEKKRFQGKILFFLEDKYFTGVGGLEVTDEMRIIVAAEACLLITNLEGDVYPGLKNIYLTEDVFIPRENPVNAATGLPTHVARLGEAWKRGPVVLSWSAIAQGSSVIYHEFSHQLDQLDGAFDGTPELGKRGNYDRWARVMGNTFLELRKRVASHKGSDIDPYGATNEAEFFAVVTEYFFTKPRILLQRHPEIYGIYKDFFRLDPANW